MEVVIGLFGLQKQLQKDFFFRRMLAVASSSRKQKSKNTGKWVIPENGRVLKKWGCLLFYFQDFSLFEVI